MNLLRCYLRKKQVIIPTIAKADAGFYLDAEPVHVFDLSDASGIKKELVKQQKEQEHEIPTPASGKAPGSVILEKLHLTNWQNFEKETVMYTLHRGNEGAALYVTGRAANGLWSHNKDFEHKFPESASAEEIADSIMERMVWQAQIEWPDKPAAMLAPPSNN
ncbi:MAG: hypothetical protein K2Y22_09430 [Candidatus Obscuribacterales bacterium]|nr:hypothetical protein [Candidatus Obscuribacterales bacterium]